MIVEQTDTGRVSTTARWSGLIGDYQHSMDLGELLLATVFPLVMRKVFGRSAGVAVITLGAIAALVTLPLSS